jgi:hypothetical protein
VACGDRGGNLHILEGIGLESGPVVVTPFNLGDGCLLRCPYCLDERPLDRQWLGGIQNCSNSRCRKSMRVNPFVAEYRKKEWEEVFGARDSEISHECHQLDRVMSLKGIMILADKDSESFLERRGMELQKEMNRFGMKFQIDSVAIDVKQFFEYSNEDGLFENAHKIQPMMPALRIFVDKVDSCYQTLGVVNQIWRPQPGMLKDFVAMPKEGLGQFLLMIVTGEDERPFAVLIGVEPKAIS